MGPSKVLIPSSPGKEAEHCRACNCHQPLLHNFAAGATQNLSRTLGALRSGQRVEETGKCGMSISLVYTEFILSTAAI